MSKTSLSSVTIILVIVIALVGLGGGYFYTSSTLQPKIDNLNQQVNDKSNQITILSTQISEKDSKINQLNVTARGLQSQVNTLQTIDAAKSATISAQTHQLQESEATLDERNSQIAVFQNRTTPSSGYLSVNMYGFSSESPMNLTLSTVGVMDAVANSNSGMLKMAKSDSEYLILTYVYRTVAPDVDASIDIAKESIASFNPVYGPRTTVSIDGYTMKYERYSATDSIGVYNGE